MNGTITRGSIKTQRKEEKETVSNWNYEARIEPRSRSWTWTQMKVKWEEGEKKSLRRQMKLWGLSNLNSVRLKSDKRGRQRKAQRGDSWRKLRKDIGFPPNKRENSTKTKEREKKKKDQFSQFHSVSVHC